MQSRVAIRAYLCRITLYVLFRGYITAVLFSTYSQRGSVLRCVIRCKITAVSTAYTLLATLIEMLERLKLYELSHEKGTIEHLQVYEKHIKELKARKVESAKQRSITSFFVKK